LNAPAELAAFELKLIADPVIPMAPVWLKTFAQPVRPAGINVSNRGVVRGKLNASITFFVPLLLPINPVPPIAPRSVKLETCSLWRVVAGKLAEDQNH